MEKGRSALNILTGRPIPKRLLGRPKSRSEENSIMDLQKIDINTRNSVDSAQDKDYLRALVKTALSPRVS